MTANASRRTTLLLFAIACILFAVSLTGCSAQREQAVREHLEALHAFGTNGPANPPHPMLAIRRVDPMVLFPRQALGTHHGRTNFLEGPQVARAVYHAPRHSL